MGKCDCGSWIEDDAPFGACTWCVWKTLKDVKLSEIKLSEIVIKPDPKREYFDNAVRINNIVSERFFEKHGVFPDERMAIGEPFKGPMLICGREKYNF